MIPMFSQVLDGLDREDSGQQGGDVPATQLTHWSVPWWSVLENQLGSSLLQLMENETKVMPRMNMISTVRMDRTANTEMIVARAEGPTQPNAEAKPAVGSMP